MSRRNRLFARPSDRALPILLLLGAGIAAGCTRTVVVETDPRGPTSPNPTPIPAARMAVTAPFPGERWERIESPESAGYSSSDLNALHQYVGSINTSACG